MEKPEQPQTLDEVMDASMTEEPQEEAQAETQESNEAEPQQEEESYTRIDPKTLPPELQTMHKSLLGDYTRKTQELARMRKEIEEQRKQATQQPPQEQTQVQKPVKDQIDFSQMSVEEYNAYILSQVEERITAAQQAAVEAQEQKYLDKAVAEFEAADERLNPESPAYDEDMRTAIGTKLDKALSDYQKENGTAIGFDYQSTTQTLLDEYEKKLEEKANQIASRKTQEAFKGVKRTAPTSAKSSKVPSKPSGKMSLDDALDAAFS